MERRDAGKSGLSFMPLVFGGNVFGWTIDEAQSFRVLDAFVDHGFDAIDTADVYSSWKPGNKGGESETIIGAWLKARPGMRQRVKIFTKVGSDLGQPGQKGLSSGWIAEAAENSLRRLGVESIDLYFSHWPDAEARHEDTLGAYDRLLKAGKIKAIGASNYDAALLGAALKAAGSSLPRYQVIQPEYNLYDRGEFEGPLRDLCLAEGIGVVTYFSLASGFLSGKYRSKADLDKSARGDAVEKYLDAKGLRILEVLDDVASARSAKPAEVALAWVMAQPGITAPIASATSVDQVASFARAADLSLSSDELAALTAAGD
ncbi:aldo/keto reductase [Pseudomonas sp. GX19020]|uniref:aldo/keto reductase n=1 Tax=Pseudomonas sp. GX19020 TaxID=2942277 RepID=UPI0020199DB0|nr:aldo/keto reductase [Pseudomonas sp. GX19020]MCL4068284.1 aldo/keto reductase [Pseudomonas sp. GX19020]